MLRAADVDCASWASTTGVTAGRYRASKNVKRATRDAHVGGRKFLSAAAPLRSSLRNYVKYTYYVKAKQRQRVSTGNGNWKLVSA